MNSQTPQQLIKRRNRLRELAREIDDELTAIEGALGVHGARRSGRPRAVNLLTDEEALDCRRRHREGERTEYVIEGRRQYLRTAQRRRRRQGGD